VDPRLKRKLAGGAAGLALLAGAGGAYAVSRGGSGDRQAFLNDVAKRLNVSPQQLTAAFKGALSDKLDADVAAGRITRAQADAIKQEAQEHGGVPFPPPGRPGFGPPPGGPPPGGPPPGGPPPLGGPPHGLGGPGGPGGPRGPGGPFMAGLDAAAKYLGLTDAQLRTQLQSGKSLAQVAGDRNKPVAGLKSAIEAAVKKDLDQAVSDKRLTQQQENRILAGLHSRLDIIVNRTGGARPRRFGPRGRMRGPHW
jgi:AraC-like DNA-binding protein